jgi:hypothetical protein
MTDHFQVHNRFHVIYISLHYFETLLGIKTSQVLLSKNPIQCWPHWGQCRRLEWEDLKPGSIGGVSSIGFPLLPCGVALVSSWPAVYLPDL